VVLPSRVVCPLSRPQLFFPQNFTSSKTSLEFFGKVGGGGPFFPLWVFLSKTKWFSLQVDFLSSVPFPGAPPGLPAVPPPFGKSGFFAVFPRVRGKNIFPRYYFDFTLLNKTPQKTTFLALLFFLVCFVWTFLQVSRFSKHPLWGIF